MTGTNPYLGRRRAGRARELETPRHEVSHRLRCVIAIGCWIDASDSSLRRFAARHQHRAGEPSRAILQQPGSRFPVEMGEETK